MEANRCRLVFSAGTQIPECHFVLCGNKADGGEETLPLKRAEHKAKCVLDAVEDKVASRSFCNGIFRSVTFVSALCRSRRYIRKGVERVQSRVCARGTVNKVCTGDIVLSYKTITKKS